ncbi:MAG: hypothetical protein H0V01_14105 [Bacteroidetes bacterium]|nr:hypothetical protein [Bacteroidota bacterium]HET6245125.1 hypothetical protein [Bacteroidia bacterium]
MKSSRFIISILFLMIFIFSSCKKAGIGGNVELAVNVKHHNTLIPNAVVYIKYGAREFPGTESKNYDNSAICGDQDHLTGHTHFSNLKKGYYYLYSVGWDSTINMTVAGGVPVQIKDKAGEMIIEIPVSEQH